MKKKFSHLLVIILGLSFIITACGAMAPDEKTASEMAPEAPAMDMDYAEMGEEAAAEERGFDTGTGDSSAMVERMVIYNANLHIAVENPEDAMAEVIEMADAAGGYVVHSNLYKVTTDRGSQPRASLTVRVPSGQLDSIMDAIKRLTPNPREDVISENVTGQDVTAEFTDLESRLRNLEAAEEQLVALMEEARDPQDVLDIFNELTYYRGEIETIKGRMKYLRDSADMSAISIEIVAKESIQPIEIGGWQPKGTAKRAVEALINTAQFLGDAAIWLGIYCLPFLIPLGIAVYFLVRGIRRRKAKKKAEKESHEILSKEG